ncbi:MAG: hypothetical protein IJF84_12250 [Thermoguttaceae bacterium]|nr:hypothetical protein [Thermoguttaceae bacterium]
MSIRIYALAKDFDIESKILIVLCRQLGIKSNASALTILTDDDAAKIKGHLARNPQKTVADFAPPVNNAPAPPLPKSFGKASGVTQNNKSRSKSKAPAKSKASGSALSNLTVDDAAKIKARLKQLSLKKEGCRFPIRLYLLAKELEVDAKVLCDLCQQLSINCKGGALTNLMSADVAKIKAHFEQ